MQEPPRFSQIGRQCLGKGIVAGDEKFLFRHGFDLFTGQAIVAKGNNPQAAEAAIAEVTNLMIECGVIDGGDMTPEAAYAKLAHVNAHWLKQRDDAWLAGETARRLVGRPGLALPPSPSARLP